jgi:hypothetical protein
MNNDTPTPSQIETNAAKSPNGLRACAIGILKKPDVVIASVIMDHAADKMEQLERELAAVTKERDQLKRWTSVNGVIDLQRERDEARAEAQLYRNFFCKNKDEIKELLLPWETKDNYNKL